MASTQKSLTKFRLSEYYFFQTWGIFPVKYWNSPAISTNENPKGMLFKQSLAVM